MNRFPSRKFHRLTPLVALLAAAPGADAAWPWGAPRSDGTLAGLDARQPELRPQQPVQADAAQAAASYREYLALPNGDPALRATALRRLGDLQLATAEADEAAAADYAALAIDAYEQWLREQPDAPGRDRVRYQLARALELAGRPAESLAALDTLVDQHPAGAHYAEAQFRRGESLFAAGRYAESERAYAAVIAGADDDEFVAAALYKQGWAHFRLGQDVDSARAFLALLDRLVGERAGAVAPAALGRAQRELLEDSLRALSIGFMQGEGEVALAAALGRHGAVPYEALLYRALGDLYVEKERYQDAAQAYRAFAQRKPGETDAARLLIAATAAYRRGGFDSLVLEGRRELVLGYGPDSAWWRANAAQLAPEVGAALQEDLLELARHHHALAQRPPGSAGEADEAIRWYRAYLSGFAAQPQAQATRLLLADLLYERGRAGEAAPEYERVAYDYPQSADSPRAAYAALVAYDAARASLPEAAREAWQVRSVAAALRFADRHPDHAEVPAVLTRTTETLYEAGERVAAAELAGRVLGLGERAQPAQLRVAWNVLASLSFADERYSDAERAYGELLARTASDDPARAGFGERLAASIYRQGEARQAAGDVPGAVGHWLRIAPAVPDSPIRATAEFDAAMLLLEARQWTDAAGVLEAFRRAHPQDARVPEATQHLAVAYLEAGQPREAARELEQVAELPGQDAGRRRAALWQAAEAYAGVGDGVAATRTYARYVERFPQPLDPAMDARRALADLALASGDRAALQHWLEQLLLADAAAGAARSERSRYLAANAALELAGPLDESARALRLRLPLERSLEAKRAALEAALGAYRRAADFAIATVTTQATQAMAELYRELGHALLDSERPTDLNAEELEQYSILLEEQAFPFEEKAIELHALNAARAADGVFDEGVQRSYRALAELKPARYSRVERSVPLSEPSTPRDLAALEAAVAAAPTDAPLLNRLGVAYREAGRFDAAEASYVRAIAADPMAAAPHCNLAILLDLYRARSGMALGHYEQCQALSGGADPQIAAWLVEVRARLGQTQQRTAEVGP